MAVPIDSAHILSDEERKTHVRVFAGPGAGKTHFIVQNIKNIIEHDNVITKSLEKRILCITYTNAAANEIASRLKGYEKRISVGTVHSFISENIVSKFQQDLKFIMEEDFGIHVATNHKISSQIEGLGILHGREKEDIYKYIATELKVPTLHIEYSKKAMGNVQVDIKRFWKSDGEAVKEIAHKDIETIHCLPIKKFIWSQVRQLTHDEILYFGYRIIQENPFALHSLRVKFPYIVIDEFQDTSPLQTRLIKLIGEKNSRVIVVGDTAQSIYSFQGAHPSDFLNLQFENQLVRDYVINDNRRSNGNIVNFCNFIRQSDVNVLQESLRDKIVREEGNVPVVDKIHFLLGDGASVKEKIISVVDAGGVVLTRTWAAAFSYARGIDESQARVLSNIYNSYYPTTIQMRDEIIDKNNVTWIRAFRFILMLKRGYSSGSLNLILNALELQFNVKKEAITVLLLRQLNSLCAKVFNNDDELPHLKVVDIIEKWNATVEEEEFCKLNGSLGVGTLKIAVFDELEQDRRRRAIEQIQWNTANILFNEIFSVESLYMTVHQAKGLEWSKVVVAVKPTRNDGLSLQDLYNSPTLMSESSADEFTRMFYVACSRAKDELYIHVPSDSNLTKAAIEAALGRFKTSKGIEIDYDFI